MRKLFLTLHELFLPLIELRNFQLAGQGWIIAIPALLAFGSQAHDLEHDLVGSIFHMIVVFDFSTKFHWWAHGDRIGSAQIPVAILRFTADH